MAAVTVAPACQRFTIDGRFTSCPIRIAATVPNVVESVATCSPKDRHGLGTACAEVDGESDRLSPKRLLFSS
jgi:hypothetical protein